MPLAWAEARRATPAAPHLDVRALARRPTSRWSRSRPPIPRTSPSGGSRSSVRDQVPKKPKKPPRPVVLPVACPPLRRLQPAAAELDLDRLDAQVVRPQPRSERHVRRVQDARGARVRRLGRREPRFPGGHDEDRDGAEQPGPRTKRLLKLSVEATDNDRIDRLPPTLDFPLAAIRSPEVKVKAGQFIRISVDIAKPMYHPEGHGGVIIRDSIGASRCNSDPTTSIIDLTPVVLFRRAPADGVVTVTLGLAAYGEAYFNNFKVEVAEGPGAARARRPRRAARPGCPTRRPRRRISPGTAARPAPVPRTNR